MGEQTEEVRVEGEEEEEEEFEMDDVHAEKRDFGERTELMTTSTNSVRK